MLVTNITIFIHHQQGRNTPKFENIPFLPVQVGYFMGWVRQANERQVIFREITPVGIGAIRPDGNNFRVTRGETGIVIP